MQVAVATWAERARSLLADSSFATLRTAAGISDVSLAGRAVLELDRDAPAVAGLARCRVATLVVPGEWSLRIVASYRMGRPDDAGRRAYEPTLLSVRLTQPSGRSVIVPVEEFLRAEPAADVVRRRALADHLRAEHADEHPGVEWVLVDGGDVVLVTPSGVDRRPRAEVCSCR